MRISGLGFSGTPAFGHLRMRQAAPEAGVAPVSRQAENRDLLKLAELLQGLRGALEGSAARIGNSRGGSLGGALRLSSATFDFVPVSPARLRSSEEVNTVPTSFGPFGPGWTGSSGSVATLGGVYDGDQGDQVLTFRSTIGGVVGFSAVRIDVFDESGARVDRLNFGLGYSAGTPVTLQNGLTLALGSGLVLQNDEFEVQVSTSVGSAVDPTKPFNGVRNQRPNFQPGLGVTAGSFQVNGVSIAVAANDTLDSVLAKISASAAGVSALFDAATETVVLQQATPGAAGQIAFSNDTSGFVAATKLTSAVLEPGTDSDLDRPIGEVAALTGIQSGTLFINGQALALDVAQDSLAEVLERLQAPPLGILARFDEARGTLVFGGGRRLELDDGGTRFFETLGIATGVHRARAGRSSRGFSDPAGVRRQLVELERGWKELFAADLLGTAKDLGERLKKKLETAVRSGFESVRGGGTGDLLRSGLGLDFDWSEQGRGLVLDSRSLERALRENAGDVAHLLLGEGSRGGLIAGWQQALRESAAALATVLESRGLGFVDLRG